MKSRRIIVYNCYQGFLRNTSARSFTIAVMLILSVWINRSSGAGFILKFSFFTTLLAAFLLAFVLHTWFVVRAWLVLLFWLPAFILFRFQPWLEKVISAYWIASAQILRDIFIIPLMLVITGRLAFDLASRKSLTPKTRRLASLTMLVLSFSVYESTHWALSDFTPLGLIGVFVWITTAFLLAFDLYTWFAAHPWVLLFVWLPIFSFLLVLPRIGEPVTIVDTLPGTNPLAFKRDVLALLLKTSGLVISAVLFLMLTITGRLAVDLLSGKTLSPIKAMGLVLQSYGALILGMAFIYNAMFEEDAFHGVTAGFSEVDALYFSAITGATVGYGDIYPVSAAAKLLVMFEVWAAQFVVVILVAVVIAGLTARR